MPIRFIAALAALALSAGPALAHAQLLHAAPRVGSTVATPPTEVAIDFSEEVEPSFSSIVVTDAKGVRVDRRDVHAAPGDAKHLVVDLVAVPAGKYTVVWHATSVDTHKTQGRFTFTVRP